MVLKFYDNEVTKKAYLGKQSKDLSMLLTSQAAQVYLKRDIVFPVAVSSTLSYIHKHGPISLGDMSVALGHPHQTIAQHIATLVKLEIVEKHPDAHDRRRMEFSLTNEGKKQAQLLEDCMCEMALVYEALFVEIGADLGKLLTKTYDALKNTPLIDRVPEVHKEKMVE